MTLRTKPLDGIRVIDTADDRGELCGRLLADLGADVIRVEPPAGARSRQSPPFAPHDRSSLYFALRNAGKRGISLDIASGSGRETLHQLLSNADIWIESNPPGFLAQQGLDPRDVLQRHPSLIITSITDFGQTGPYRDFVGTDMVSYAMGGMLYRAGAAHRPPVAPPGSQAYDTAGATAAFATVTAYFRRLKSGRGQWLDVSVQESTSNLADWSVPIYSTMQIYSRREGAGMYPVYRCADGWVRMIVIGLKHWKTLRAWMGEPAELQDATYDEFIARVWNRETIEPFIQRHFREWKKVDAAREAQSRGIPATPVLLPSEVLDNEHTRARGTFTTLELLPGRPASVPSGFFELDGVRMGPTRRAPTIGEHTAQVLAEAHAGRGAAAAARPSTSSGRAEVVDAADSGAARPVPAEERAESVWPFTGIRVLDFGVGVAGVEVGRLFAEYGAEVIKIESSKALDFIRTVIPGKMNAPFASSNRSKLGFGVDLKTPVGVELMHRLVRTADVVVENSATGVMDRLGLGYDVIKAINPRIVMFSTQLTGSSGPWSKWSGYGPNAHAVSGLQYLWNYPEDADQPAGSTNIHPDHLVARLGALGVVAALIRRERDGAGAHVEVAQFEALVQLLGDLFAKESLDPSSVGPQGNRSDRGVPWGVYACSGDDEWCVINVRSDAEWGALRAALGHPDWSSRPEYASVEGRQAAQGKIDDGISAWTCEHSAFEIMNILQAHGVPAGVVEHPQFQVEDPHLKARDFFRTIEQPALGTIVLEGPGFRASDMAGPKIEPAPLLGQHTRMICRSLLNLSDAEIDTLFADGVLEETLPE